ncbi:MAG TPA: transcriptional regulator MntR [Bacillota bacterium]
MEDYLETIYELIQEKGYARVSDIAAALDLQPSSVTRMVQKLDEQRYVVYERYRGLVLTARGEQIGRQMRRRHRTLEQFLRQIGVDDEAIIQQDVEGIEHHVSLTTMNALRRLVEFMDEHPQFLRALAAYVQAGDRAADVTVDRGGDDEAAR